MSWPRLVPATWANEAMRRIAAIHRAERELANLASEERLHMRQAVTRPMWEELHLWLRLERSRVPDGGATAKALNYSLNAWDALTRNLVDDVPVDNNHCENQIRPWAMGRRAWLFAGSELAGQRARRRDELGPIRQTLRARPVRLSQGRPRALAHAHGKPHRRPPAAPLATPALTPRHTNDTLLAAVKVGQPSAYLALNAEQDKNS